MWLVSVYGGCVCWVVLLPSWVCGSCVVLVDRCLLETGLLGMSRAYQLMQVLACWSSMYGYSPIPTLQLSHPSTRCCRISRAWQTTGESSQQSRTKMYRKNTAAE